MRKGKKIFSFLISRPEMEIDSRKLQLTYFTLLYFTYSLYPSIQFDNDNNNKFVKRMKKIIIIQTTMMIMIMMDHCIFID